MPAVSVIIPTRNRATVLHEALESVRSQTFDDFEAIVVDDRSENQAEVERVIAALHDPRFKAVYLDHRVGPAAARNRGVREAQGEFLSFLDDDDMLMPDKLRIHSELLRANCEIAMIYSDEYVIDRSGRMSDKPLRSSMALPSGKIAREFLIESFIGTMTVTLRKAVFDEVEGFDEELIWNEDDDLWLRIMIEHRVECSEYPAGIRRLHQSNMSVNRTRMVLSQLRCIEKYAWMYPRFVEENADVITDRTQRLWRSYMVTRLRQRQVPNPKVLLRYSETRRKLRQVGGRREAMACAESAAP